MRSVENKEYKQYVYRCAFYCDSIDKSIETKKGCIYVNG